MICCSRRHAGARSGGRRRDTLCFCVEREATHPISSIPPQFAHALVRLENVLGFFEMEEMRRKRKRTFLLEVVFLCFFLPFCLYFIFSPQQGVHQALTNAEFPLFFPSNSSEYQNAVRMHRFDAGYFPDENSFWQWMNNILFAQVFISGNNATTVGTTKSTDYSNEAISQPIIVGQVRVRQIRVRASAACPRIFSQPNNNNLTCYPAFSSEVEETRPFASYEYSASTGEMEFQGRLATYPDSGYVAYLNSAEDLLALRASFDLRAVVCVIITLTVFDPNNGLVSNLRLGVEFSNSGGTVTSESKTATALYYRTDADLIAMQALQILVLVAEFLYVAFRLNEIGLFRSNPLSKIQVDSPVWLALDCVQLALVVYISYLTIPMLFLEANTELERQVNRENFFNGEGLTSLSVTVLELSGIVFWIGTLVVFKSTEYFKSMRLWHQVINRIAWDALLFFAFIALFCLGFVACAWVVFGPSAEEFSTFGAAAFAVMNMLVLVVDFDRIARMRPFGYAIAPVFFVPFLLFFTWYLFCVLVGIVYLRYKQEKMAREERKLRERQWVRRAIKLGARKTLPSRKLGTGRRKNYCRSLFGLPAHHGFASNHHALERLRALDPRKQCFLSFAKLVSLLKTEEEEEGQTVLSAQQQQRREDGTQYQPRKSVEDAHVHVGEDGARLSIHLDLDNALATGEDDNAGEDEDAAGLHRTFSHRSSSFGGLPPPLTQPGRYHPLVAQSIDIFERFYLIPSDRADALSSFYKLEESMVGEGVHASRACLLRMQTALDAMNREATEGKQAVLERLASLRVEQRNLTKELLDLRKVLKE